MTELVLNRRQYLEFEKIALNAFAPLTGFMNEDDFHSVVNTMRLTDGQVFPLPIVLDLSPAEAKRIAAAPKVTLIFNHLEVGLLHPESRYQCDKEELAPLIFGTSDPSHPGVDFFHHMGAEFVGGQVELTARATLDISAFELTPDESRALFASKNWSRIVGFQTRNVPHRAHEYLQRVALEQVDGLFIQPIVGRKRPGDFTPEAIMNSYRALIDGFYPDNRVVLGILSTFMRYAGPKEAVFHAIVRRNYGCTDFVVGRDHAGVGDFYGKYEAHDLIAEFQSELGINVMRLHGPYYCKRCDGCVTEHTCGHPVSDPSAVVEVSGTYMREILAGGRRPDPHLMRPEIVDSIQNAPIFIEDYED